MRAESRADVQDGVLACLQLRAFQDAGETALHGAHGGDDALRVDIDIDERLDEARSVFLELRKSLNGRVDGALALVQRLLLGFNADGAGGNSGYAELQMGERLVGLGFQHAPDHGALPDGRVGNIVNAQLPEFFVQEGLG